MEDGRFEELYEQTASGEKKIGALLVQFALTAGIFGLAALARIPLKSGGGMPSMQNLIMWRICRPIVPFGCSRMPRRR